MNQYKPSRTLLNYIICEHRSYRNAIYIDHYGGNRLIMRKFHDGKMIIIGYKHQKIFLKKINVIANESL